MSEATLESIKTRLSQAIAELESIVEQKKTENQENKKLQGEIADTLQQEIVKLENIIQPQQ